MVGVRGKGGGGGQEFNGRQKGSGKEEELLSGTCLAATLCGIAS